VAGVAAAVARKRRLSRGRSASEKKSGSESGAQPAERGGAASRALLGCFLYGVFAFILAVAAPSLLAKGFSLRAVWWRYRFDEQLMERDLRSQMTLWRLSSLFSLYVADSLAFLRI